MPCSHSYNGVVELFIPFKWDEQGTLWWLIIKKNLLPVALAAASSKVRKIKDQPNDEACMTGAPEPEDCDWERVEVDNLNDVQGQTSSYSRDWNSASRLRTFLLTALTMNFLIMI